MMRVYRRVCFFFLGGAIIATLVTGDAWPVLITCIVLVILKHVYRAIGT